MLRRVVTQKPNIQRSSSVLDLAGARCDLLDLTANLLKPGTKLYEQVTPELGKALLELRVEPREVQLVQLPEIGAVREVHGVEPVHRSLATSSPRTS